MLHPWALAFATMAAVSLMASARLNPIAIAIAWILIQAGYFASIVLSDRED
jgi:hypothetical protein